MTRTRDDATLPAMRTRPLLLILTLCACESIDGSVTIDGAAKALDNCEKVSGTEVIFDTDETVRIRLQKTSEGDVASIGTGACTREEETEGCDALGFNCGKRTVCYAHDWFSFPGCTKLEITDTNTKQGDVVLVDVTATMDCSGGGRSLVGSITASNCR